LSSFAQETPAERWERYRRLLAEEPLPAALVDLDALDANIERVCAPVRARGKRLRIATKSIRCPDLVRYIEDRAGEVRGGLMTYTAAETAFYAARGHGDLLLAYPAARETDLFHVCRANRVATAAIVVDDARQIEALGCAACREGVVVPVVVEIDLSWRPAGDLAHVGVRRSPLRTPEDVAALAERASRTEGLRFHGVMGYEAQIAGLPDANPFARAMSLAARAVKRLSRHDVVRRRQAVREALRARGLDPVLFNGGGTGSLAWSSAEDALTEVTAGSGFLGSHLFDYYRDFHPLPAACFALQVVRQPARGLFTCHGGGYVASGAAGPDRLPQPYLPEGLALLPLEGAGEVQTPLRLPAGVRLDLGDPVFFRHAKAGELAEHFAEYLLVRGDRVEGRARTYRGLGECFLG
jgi:D-serine deaminase-like pyridoxal phosphate-dependent protein